jgi:hypothetical protein
MTVNTTDITSGPYVGNNIVDEFSYDFRVEDKNQLIVFETSDTGVETTLTVDTDYTVAGIGVDGGGLITRTAGPLPTNYIWYIRSNYQETQLTSFESQGAFFPAVHEAAMDKLTFLIQQILDEKNRSPKVSDSYSGVLPLTLEPPEAGQIVRWKGDLTGFENIEISEISPGLISSDKLIIHFGTLNEAVNSTDETIIKNGAVLRIKDQVSNLFDVVLLSTVTPNAYDIFASVGVPSLAFVMRDRGQLEGTSNKRYVVLGGVLRNDGLGGGWQWLDDAGHNPVGFTASVSVVDGFKLQVTSTVTHPNAKVINMNVSPDETFQLEGMNVGASVGVGTSSIQSSFPLRFYFAGTVLAGISDAHTGEISVVNQNGRLEFTHPIMGGVNGSRGPTRTVIPWYNGTSNAPEIHVSHQTSTLTYVYGIKAMSASISYNGASWDVVTEADGAITANFSGSLCTITHPIVDIDDVALVSPGQSSLIPTVWDQTTTTTRIAFRDYTGVLVSPATTDMKFKFQRGKATVSPALINGMFDGGQAVAYWDGVEQPSANIWVTGLIEIDNT